MALTLTFSHFPRSPRRNALLSSSFMLDSFRNVSLDTLDTGGNTDLLILEAYFHQTNIAIELKSNMYNIPRVI